MLQACSQRPFTWNTDPHSHQCKCLSVATRSQRQPGLSSTWNELPSPYSAIQVGTAMVQQCDDVHEPQCAVTSEKRWERTQGCNAIYAAFKEQCSGTEKRWAVARAWGCGGAGCTRCEGVSRDGRTVLRLDFSGGRMNMYLSKLTGLLNVNYTLIFP